MSVKWRGPDVGATHASPSWIVTRGRLFVRITHTSIETSDIRRSSNSLSHRLTLTTLETDTAVIRPE